MICPNCGKEIKDDKLLCEYCGEEVRFVPLFDAEIENQIDETINNIIKNLNNTDSSKEKESTEDKDDAEDKSDEKEKYYQSIAITALGIICTLILVWLGIRFLLGLNTSSSFSFQYNKALDYLEKEEYEDSIKYFEHALKIEPDNVDARYNLGVLYIKTGQYQSGILALEEMLNLDIEDKNDIYNSLLEAVLDNKDYEKMAIILNDCPYTDIITKYIDFTANVPEFNNDEGVYKDKLALEITNINPKGIIYYTTDGSKPTTNSPVYTKPIDIESGEYTVKAMFVNLYGCSSDVISKSFYISLSHPNVPEVVLDSDIYDEPCLIEIYHDKSTKIYYTMDGTLPDEKSFRYTEPFEMPYGTSNFAFIAVSENGLKSEVIRRTYQLKPEPTISEDIALGIVKNHLIVKGEILDKEGNLKDKSGHNEYFIRTYIKKDEKYYYIIDEYYVDNLNNETKTNNTYAIDSKDGTAYKAVKTGESKYNLKKI